LKVGFACKISTLKNRASGIIVETFIVEFLSLYKNYDENKM